MNKHHPVPSAAATLDVDVMTSFVAIADSGSMTLAADKVGRTPAALSMQLKKLEEMMGRRLFTRGRKGMALTSEGKRLLVYARRMVDLNREALEAFRGPALTGEITIGLVDDLGYAQLAFVMAEFAKSHPAVTVNVVMASSMSMGPMFDRGELDLALLSPGCAISRRDSDVHVHEEELTWIGAEGGSAVACTPLPVAVADRGCAWRRMTIDALGRSGRDYRVAYISDFDAAILAAVAADLAVGAMPRSRLGPGLVELPASAGLPQIGASEIVLRMGPHPECATRELAAHIQRSYADCRWRRS